MCVCVCVSQLWQLRIAMSSVYSFVNQSILSCSQHLLHVVAMFTALSTLSLFETCSSSRRTCSLLLLTTRQTRPCTSTVLWPKRKKSPAFGIAFFVCSAVIASTSFSRLCPFSFFICRFFDYRLVGRRKQSKIKSIRHLYKCGYGIERPISNGQIRNETIRPKSNDRRAANSLFTSSFQGQYLIKVMKSYWPPTSKLRGTDRNKISKWKRKEHRKHQPTMGLDKSTKRATQWNVLKEIRDKDFKWTTSTKVTYDPVSWNKGNKKFTHTRPEMFSLRTRRHIKSSHLCSSVCVCLCVRVCVCVCVCV